MTIQVQTLFSLQSAAAFLNAGLELAASLGLPVTTWRAGDPTRTLYHFLAESLAERDSTIAEFIKAGFLSTAEDEWLTVLASEVYGVEREEAAYSTPTVTLRNDGGGYYDLSAGDLSVKSTESGVTFHNTDAVAVLSAGVTVTYALVADVAGSTGSVGVDEIDALVTTLPGVVVVSSTAAAGSDGQSDEELREQCRASRGALSPNGPRDAYEYVARDSTRTGVTGVTRARAVGDGGTGAVSVYVATSSGAATAEVVAAVQDAIDLWATPLTVNATVASASALAVTLTVTANKSATNGLSDASIQSAFEAALVALFAATKIGGIDGGVSVSRMTSALHATLEGGYDSIAIAEGAITLAATQVPVLAALALTVS